MTRISLFNSTLCLTEFEQCKLDCFGLPLVGIEMLYNLLFYKIYNEYSFSINLSIAQKDLCYSFLFSFKKISCYFKKHCA